jgi:hypothetical protein
MGNSAGIDWASEKHDVLIEDPVGEELLAATFRHDEDGVSALCAAMVLPSALAPLNRPHPLAVLVPGGRRALHASRVAPASSGERCS